jgi:copper oxidase (laccase) domain-containing protein
MDVRVPVETFAALERVGGIRHAFLCRVPGLDVRTEREEALERLAEYHAEARVELGFGRQPFATAKQVHGARIAVLREGVRQEAAETDGLVTDVVGLTLGVYVADCCAIYLADPVRRAIGLAHSGKKGTELGIAERTVERMVREYGCEPTDMVAQLSPCIRPPEYEVDFAAEIVRQLRGAGVGTVVDCGANTAADPERYYSYRMEKGRTGRLLALLERF